MRRPLAEADILEIWDYIADDNIAAADDWVDRLDEQFRLLATQPKIGRTRDELAAGMRSFPVGRYVVFYMPLDDGVDVIRVLHGSRDIDAIFRAQP
jgi:toxin ParE1/3/4